MRLWILPLLAVSLVGGLLWLAAPGRRVSPQGRLEAARSLLTVRPPDVSGALEELDEGLRQARGAEWAALRPALLRERSKLYASRGAKELALADCRTELAESGPHAETLARATDLCLALDDPSQALELAEQLTALAPERGKGRIGRARLALADRPLAAIERLAHASLPATAAESVKILAQRATVFADDASRSAVALEDLREHFPRADERRRVEEWVREATEHLRFASSAFVEALAGSTGEAVAGLQDLLARGGAEREAIDLGLVALAIPTLSSPMPVLARTARALSELGRVETARALILELRRRNPAGLKPQELSNLALESELGEWCLVLERLSLWDELRIATEELYQRAGERVAQRELALFLFASADLAQDRLQNATNSLQGLGTNIVDQHDLRVRAWLLRAAVARRQGQRPQERHALLSATKLAPLDERREPLRSDLGRAWQRLFQLQRDEGDVLAAEISLTHAMRCSSARAAELEPLWHELGQTALAGRGVSSPYLLHARAKAELEMENYAKALVDAEALLEDYPGLALALEVVARASSKLRDYPRTIAASLELLERGAGRGAASTLLRAVPREYFLPQDRVRWLQLDPRGSLEDVLQRLLAKGDLRGAALAARGGPPSYQAPELLPLLAEIQYRAGLVRPALFTLEALPADSAPFRSCASLALRAGLDRTLQGDQDAFAGELAKVLASGAPEDEGLLHVVDVLLGIGRQRDAKALLDWMAEGPFLGGWLLRSAAARAVARAAPENEHGSEREGRRASPRDDEMDEDLERAASLLDDGMPELGRLILASARDDAAALRREARVILDTRSGTPLASSPAARAALLALADESARASEVLSPLALDGRDFELELVAAAVAALVPERSRIESLLESGLEGSVVTEAPPEVAELSPVLLESVPPARLLVLALAAGRPPWSAWTLASTAELSPASKEDPWIRGLRARSLMALSLWDLALVELGAPGGARGLEGLRARLLRERGAPAEVVLSAELDWFHARGSAPLEEPLEAPELVLLAAESALRKGERAEAVRILESGLESHRDQPELLAHLAELESVEGRRTRAIELYNRLLAHVPARSDEPHVLAYLDLLRAARDGREIGEARWWAEVEALEAERPQDPALARELATRSFELPVSAPGDARSHALQRLERFRARSFERPLESLRVGEASRWTELLVRFSPERALAFAEAELLRDPSDPALWRATVQTLLAVGRWEEAIERLTALQRVAPERDTGRLLAITSFRIERDPRTFRKRVEEIGRIDEQAEQDPALAFYIALNALALLPRDARGEKEAATARELWRARATNGLADAEHGRALAQALFQAGRRGGALEVLEETGELARSRLERELFAALAHLMRSAPSAPKRLIDAPLPRRLEEAVFDDAPGARKPAAAGPPAGGAPKAGAPGAAPRKAPGERPRKKKQA